MEFPLQRRLLLGIGTVAVLAGLCALAVWSARGRLHAPPAPVAAAAAPDDAMRAENLRLKRELARVEAERDAAIARDTAPATEPQPPSEPVPVEPPAATAPAAPARPSAPPVPGPQSFAEPQTFGSASTAQ